MLIIIIINPVLAAKNKIAKTFLHVHVVMQSVIDVSYVLSKRDLRRSSPNLSKA